MKKSGFTLVTIIILIILGLIFILADGTLSIGELLILIIVLIAGVLISNKKGE